jgi:hypothetical protein
MSATAITRDPSVLLILEMPRDLRRIYFVPTTSTTRHSNVIAPIFAFFLLRDDALPPATMTPKIPRTPFTIAHVPFNAFMHIVTIFTTYVGVNGPCRPMLGKS